MRSLLIVKLSSLGDVLHTLPAARALRLCYPQAHLAWAVERAHAGILRGLPWIDELIEWNRGTWRGALEFARRLRTQRWDSAIDFQGLQRSALWMRVARVQRRRGFTPGRESSHIWYDDRVDAPTEPLHAVERNLQLVAALGAVLPGVPLRRTYLGETTPPGLPVPTGSELFSLPIGAAERAAVNAFATTENLDPGAPFVILNPHCRKAANIWPAERFAALAGRLLDAGLRVVLTGGPVAAPLCSAIAERNESKIVRADGRLSLLGSAELIRRASAFVTGDTGPMHIAAAVGTPIVALFGPADPRKTGPYAADAVVVSRQLSCAPCFARHCPLRRDPPPCMDEITVDEVLAATLRQIETAGDATVRRRSA